MPTYKTDRPFSEQELINMDVIHDTNPSLFTDQNEESYVEKDFIDDSERDTLSAFFKDNFDKIGYEINGHVLHITFPMLIPTISDILRPKVLQHFGSDVVFYSDVSDDPMSVGRSVFQIGQTIWPTHGRSHTHKRISPLQGHNNPHRSRQG